MAISVNWITGEITIPKADTVLVSAGPPEIRSFDVDQFWLDLKDAEYSADGVPWPDTQVHDLQRTLSGDIYVQKIIMPQPYFPTFEDGQYVINLLGGNHNLLDVATANQVSLKAFNSAGKVNINVPAVVSKEDIAAEVNALLSTVHGAGEWENDREIMTNDATIVDEGATFLVTIFELDGTTPRAQMRTTKDGLSRTRLL